MEVRITGKITPATARSTCDEIRRANSRSSSSPLVVKIHSGGGSMAAALRIANQFKTSRRPIHTVCENRCASSAALLLMAGDRRTASRDAQILVHSSRPSTTLPRGPLATASARAYRAAERKRRRELVEAGNWVLLDYMAKSSGTPLLEMRRAFAALDGRWLDVGEAIQLGFIDAVAEDGA
jgi:ATP-dependent protease ClpP protease subunit|tara:strand:+ start:97 stop:639 length:543 start_codon:yes stop_codon:yes gene_type:complete